MRRLVMFNRVSADGYFAAQDGKLDWVVPEREIDKAAASAIDAFDTVLLGRRTYEMFASFWPKALDDPKSAPDPHGRERTPEMRAMAVMLNEATKLVFSKTLKEATWKNSHVIPEFNAREIEALKKQPGKDMIIFGSGSIVTQLAEHNLIDEYQFVVQPILLGSGKTLINDGSRRSKINLQEAKGYQSGNVMLRYVRS
jgi:dihydrofolate reductase